MKISMVVATGNNWQIGLNNKLLWHIKEDLQNFRSITLNHHVLMGRKTFEAIGKPLANRTNLILSNLGLKDLPNHVHAFSSPNDALAFAKNHNESELMVIGGGQIYSALILQATRIYWTLVDFDGPSDTFFPVLDMRHWQVQTSQKFAKSGVTPSFEIMVLDRTI